MNAIVKPDAPAADAPSGAPDLYEILGVAKDATGTEIHKAWLKACRVHHPDKNKGVQSPKWNAIRLAYDVLSDPESRKKYDEFGAMPDDDEAQLYAQAFGELSNTFLAVVAQIPLDLFPKVDLIKTIEGVITNWLKKDKADIESAMERLNDLDRVKALLVKRLKIKEGVKGNAFVSAIDRRINEVMAPVATIRKTIKVREEMLRILTNYEFDFDKKPEPATTAYTRATFSPATLTFTPFTTTTGG